MDDKTGRYPAPPYKQGTDEMAEEELPESVPLYRNFKIIIPLFILVLAIAVVAWNWYLGMRDFISTDDAYIDCHCAAVSAKMLGRIDSLMADEGDTVRVGQILIKLDDDDLMAQEKQAIAAIALAEQNVTLADVSLQKAQDDFRRAETQFKQNIITRELYDHALSELLSNQSRLKIATAQVGVARAQHGVIASQLNNTIITSPLTGVVAKRWALPGDVIQPGQSVFSIYETGNIWITANLEETHLRNLRLQDGVEAVVDAYPNQKFTGTIFQIGSNTASQFSLIPPNNASGNFTKVTQRIPVKISIRQIRADDQPAVPLLPGMSVEIKVKVQ